MSWQLIRAGVLTMVAMALFSCAPSKAPAKVEPLPPGGQIRQQTVTIGQTIQVTMVSNPSTGFKWIADPGMSTGMEHIRIVDEGFIAGESRDGMVGTPGRQWWRIRGQSAGTAVIRLTYQRPWEKDTPPSELAAISVKVIR